MTSLQNNVSHHARVVHTVCLILAKQVSFLKKILFYVINNIHVLTKEINRETTLRKGQLGRTGKVFEIKNAFPL